MKPVLLILIFVLVTGCCGAKRIPTTSVSTLQATTIEKVVRERDTIVNLPYYKVGVAIHQDKITEDPIFRKTGNARVEVYKKNDSIFATAECDSLELQLKLRDSIISTYTELKTDTTVTLPPEEIKYIPWPVKMLAWIGGLTLLYFGIRFGINFYKPKF